MIVRPSRDAKLCQRLDEMAEMNLWQFVAIGIVVAALSYSLAYVAGIGWSNAWFSRKLKHHREVLKEIDRSMTNGKDSK